MRRTCHGFFVAVDHAGRGHALVLRRGWGRRTCVVRDYIEVGGSRLRRIVVGAWREEAGD